MGIRSLWKQVQKWNVLLWEKGVLKKKINDENCSCNFIATGMKCFVRKALPGPVCNLLNRYETHPYFSAVVTGKVKQGTNVSLLSIYENKTFVVSQCNTSWHCSSQSPEKHTEKQSSHVTETVFLLLNMQTLY